MSHLERLSKTPDCAWYAVRDEPVEERPEPEAIERYVVSTDQGRRITNMPELIGVEFNLALEAAMVAVLRDAPFHAFVAAHAPAKVCVVHLLRGGLNFELRRAVHGAFGFNRHASVFMSSQRQRHEDGSWSVREDAYRKLDVPADAILMVGDVVATGVTLEHALDVLLDHVEVSHRALRGMILFTVGGVRSEEVLASFDARARAICPQYERTILVYLEGRFHMVDDETPLRIGISGTDLVRRDALISPELVLAQHEKAAWTLERCAIYDAGSRAFDIPTYIADVREYWEQLRELARQGLSLGDALDERWPVRTHSDRDSFMAAAQGWWRRLDEQTLEALWAAHQRRWYGADADVLATSAGLEALCDARIDTLDQVLEAHS